MEISRPFCWGYKLNKVKKIFLSNKKDHPAQLEPDGQSMLLIKIGCAVVVVRGVQGCAK